MSSSSQSTGPCPPASVARKYFVCRCNGVALITASTILALQQLHRIVIDGRVRQHLLRHVAPPAVNVRHRHAFHVWLRQRGLQIFRAAIARADQPNANPIIRTQRARRRQRLPPMPIPYQPDLKTPAVSSSLFLSRCHSECPPFTKLTVSGNGANLLAPAPQAQLPRTASPSALHACPRQHLLQSRHAHACRSLRRASAAPVRLQADRIVIFHLQKSCESARPSHHAIRIVHRSPCMFAVRLLHHILRMAVADARLRKLVKTLAVGILPAAAALPGPSSA